MFVYNVSGEIPSPTCVVTVTEHKLNGSSIRTVIIARSNEMVIRDHVKLGGTKGCRRTDPRHPSIKIRAVSFQDLAI